MAFSRVSGTGVRFPGIPFGKAALCICAGLILYFGYLYLVGFGAVTAGLARIDLRLVGLAFLAVLCGNFFRTAGWWLLLRRLQCRISLFRAYLVYLSGLFFSSLVPSAAISGEVGKIYFIRRSEPESRVDRIVAAGVVSRLLELVPVAAGALASIAYLMLCFSLPLWAMAFCLLAAVVVTAVALLALMLSMNVACLRAAADLLVRIIARVFKGHDTTQTRASVEAMVTQYDESVREISASRPLLLKALALAFVAWAFDVSVACISFSAVGFQVPASVIAAIYSVLLLVTMVPTFIPGGLGYVDGLMNLLYGRAGVQDAFSGTFVIRLATLWFLTAVGGLCTLCLARATGKSTRDGENP